MKTALLIALCFGVINFSAGQDRDNSSKLVVKMGEALEITADALYLDTLIMQDNSRIIFLAPETKLTINHAFIGRTCKWDASGMTEKSITSIDGRHGRRISAQVNFVFLYELEIDVRGEHGHMGLSGRQGSSGLQGSNFSHHGGQGGDGSNGGNGGDGGSITLTYNCEGFTPLFAKKGYRTIHIRNEGGQGGSGGSGGKGGAGGMPSRKILYNTSGTAVIAQRAPETGSVSPKDGPSAPVPSYNSNPTGVVVEVEGERGLPGGFGRRGQPGAEGKPGVLILNKIQ